MMIVEPHRGAATDPFSLHDAPLNPNGGAQLDSAVAAVAQPPAPFKLRNSQPACDFRSFLLNLALKETGTPWRNGDFAVDLPHAV